jgi:hypothetical protein
MLGLESWKSVIGSKNWPRRGAIVTGPKPLDRALQELSNEYKYVRVGVMEKWITKIALSGQGEVRS